jgi:NDP-sugar pyrophosphorylase family protein
MIDIENFISNFYGTFPSLGKTQPWNITNNLKVLLQEMILGLPADFITKDGMAIHKTATVGSRVSISGPVIIGPHCNVGPNTVLREGVFLGNEVHIGPSCEIKNSILGNHTATAHFNYIGNSILGSHINFEAGSIAANHYNERINKTIFVVHGAEIINTETEKFGALVGDHCKIGANAVLSPGTLLPMNSIVKRLELIDQHSQSAQSLKTP